MKTENNHGKDQKAASAIEACKSHIRHHTYFMIFPVLVSIGIITTMILFWVYYFGNTEMGTHDQHGSERLEETDQTHEKTDIDQVINSINVIRLRTALLYDTNMKLIQDKLKKIDSNLSGTNMELIQDKLKNIDSKGNLVKEVAETLLMYHDAIMKYEDEEFKDLIKKSAKLHDELPEFQEERYSLAQITPTIPDGVVYGFIACFFFIFVVVLFVYRFHAKEISKNEQYKIGFFRIQKAIENVEHGCCKPEIQESLVESAFGFPPHAFSFLKKRKKAQEAPPEASESSQAEAPPKTQEE